MAFLDDLSRRILVLFVDRLEGGIGPRLVAAENVGTLTLSDST